MVENITTVLTSLITAIGDFLTPTASENSLITAAGVAAIGTLFAVPIVVAVSRKAIGLVKSIKGN